MSDTNQGGSKSPAAKQGSRSHDKAHIIKLTSGCLLYAASILLGAVMLIVWCVGSSLVNTVAWRSLPVSSKTCGRSKCTETNHIWRDCRCFAADTSGGMVYTTLRGLGIKIRTGRRRSSIPVSPFVMTYPALLMILALLVPKSGHRFGAIFFLAV
jgi:hypothetical protein